MAFQFRRTDTSVTDGVRRMADEQLRRGLESLAQRPFPDAVHDVRKRCKKLRALVRLIRPAFPGYVEENAAFRDAARVISGARDAKVMQDTYDLLVEHFAPQIERRALCSIRRRFTLQLKAARETACPQDLLQEVCHRLEQARDRVGGWTLDADGWEAMSGGLAKTYAKARESADIAFALPSAPSFHELRKHLKYHWYQTRLLSDVWPAMMTVRSTALNQLTEQLGVHHDLHVFEQRLAADPLIYGAPADVRIAVALAAQMRGEIEARAWPETARLLSQKPKALSAHWGALWDIRHVETAPAMRTGKKG